jgi:hypothetical protein
MPSQWFALRLTPLQSALLSMSTKRLLVYAGVAAFLVFAVLYCLWTLAVYARFRKPIELSAECPSCGSKDFRSSYEVALDRIRKRIGIYPFRCRQCSKRFFRRSLRGGVYGIPGAVGH